MAVFSLQAGHDQHVRQHPDAGEDRSAPHAVPAFTAVIDRIVTRLLSFFGPAQQEPGGHGAPDRRGAGIAAGLDRNASQPVMRAPEAFDSESFQLDAAGSVAPEGLVPTSHAPAPPFARSASAARRNYPCKAKEAVDEAYRNKLTAWVASAEPRKGIQYWLAKTKVDSYLENPERNEWTLNLWNLDISTLPPLPGCVKHLYVTGTDINALPENLPQGLLTLVAQNTHLSTLPANLPKGLQSLSVAHNRLSALPENLPQDLQMLDMDCTAISTLPENLPQGLQRLYVRYTELTALPENLPRSLRTLYVRDTQLTPEALLINLQINTSITTLECDRYDAVSMQRINRQLAINQGCPANAAASLDLLSRLAFTTDQTGTLIKRASTPKPVPGRLPEPSIPAELHDVLAANCSDDLLAVLAGMVNGRRQ